MVFNGEQGRRYAAYLLLILTMLLWGSHYVVGKGLVEFGPPIMLTFLRWCVAACIVVPLFAHRVWRERSLILNHWGKLLVLSITGIVGFNVLMYVAVQYTSPINAALMSSASPVLMALTAMVVLSERLRSWQYFGIVLSLIGVLWIISHGSISAFLELSLNPGDLWMLLGVLLWAFYSVALKKWGGIFSAAVLITLTTVIGVMLLMPMVLVEKLLGQQSMIWSVDVMVGLLYVGIFPSLVALFAWNAAVARVGPSVSGLFLHLSPMVSAICSIIWLDDHVQLYHGIGALLVLGGVYIGVQHGAAKKQRVAS